MADRAVLLRTRGGSPATGHVVRTCRTAHDPAPESAARGSDVSLERIVIRDIVPRSDGTLGDGLVVLSLGMPANGTVAHTRIENSARAGILAYGGAVALGASVLECNLIHLDGENAATPYAFTMTEPSACGCQGETVTCKVLSSMLEPPNPL